MEKSSDRLFPFWSWLDGLGDVPGEFTYFCSIEKYLIAGTEFRRAPSLISCLLILLPVSYTCIYRFQTSLFLRYRCSGLPWEIEAAIALT